ncbi:hypothetical protein BGHDH14_bgh04991 [Blumeria hordei DH14]|uniref:Uncharacterized protein n=1 Tax=Blumeria graminis f. sp. hordei (strain DH14) TaxID=546991 RepID=N1J593_BLUG1|nr:hypothetical protein BGHDH14_bgh04991 [Blumeria hordei DH14]
MSPHLGPGAPFKNRKIFSTGSMNPPTPPFPLNLRSSSSSIVRTPREAARGEVYASAPPGLETPTTLGLSMAHHQTSSSAPQREKSFEATESHQMHVKNGVTDIGKILDDWVKSQMGLQKAVNLDIARILAIQFESFIVGNVISSSKLTIPLSHSGGKDNQVRHALHSASKTTPASYHRSLEIRLAKRSKRRGKRHGNRLIRHNDDRRILVFIDAPTRYSRADQYALRMTLCEEVEGLTLADIPSITPTSTGWSIALLFTKVRDLFSTENRTKIILKIMHGTEAHQLQRWLNYAVPDVPNAVLSPSRKLTIITIGLIEEVFA